jgi:hypothetical protein
MSSTPTSQAGLVLDDDQRFELGAIAARDERRNRPAHWLLLATLCFAGSLLALIWAGWSRAAAAKQLGDQRYIASQTSEICGQIQALREQAAKQGDKANQPITQIRSRLQAIAQEAGIKNKLQIPRDEEERRGASKRVKFRFDNVQDESLPALLSWLDKAVTELPGMEVYSVSIRPLANQWVMNVTFARWERAG